MQKRVLSLLLALVLIVGLLPTVALAEETGDPTTDVRVIVENTTFSVEDGAPWDGELLDEWVTLTETSTMMSCVVDALDVYGYTQTGAESNYISEINDLEAYDGGYESGWMGTLNDWFTSEGFGAYTVEAGTLTPGDEIRIMYTCNGYGADLGGDWDNNDKTVKALSFSAGSLEPAFDKDTHAYTLTVPAGTAGVLVTPTATNKNFQVRTFVGETEYKRTMTVPVADGTELLVKCGDPEWPSMNNQAGGTGGGIPAEEYTITVKTEVTPITGVTLSNGTETITVDFISGQKTYDVDVGDWNKVYVGIVGAMPGDTIWVNSTQIQYNETAIVEVTAETSPRTARVMINRGTDQPVQAWVKLTSSYSETPNYLQSLRFLNDSVDFPMDYTMVPAFTPATMEYTLYIPDIMDKTDVTAEVTLTDSAPEGTDVVFAYGDTTQSYLEKQKNQKVVLTGLVEMSDADGSLKVRVGEPEKEYTFHIIRQPVLSYLSIQDDAGTECLTPKFENILQFSGYTAYIPYEGATVLAEKCLDRTAVKLNNVQIPTITGLAVDATELWTGEAGQRQFTLSIDTSSSTEGSHAAGVYTVVCKERPVLAVKTAPTKTTYIDGEAFDAAGLVVTATYHDGEPVEIPVENLTFNTTTMTMSGGAVTASYEGATVELTGLSVFSALIGDGTEDNPYLLSSAADLALLSHLVASGETYAGKYFKITDNITLPSDWTPIGSLKEGQTWSSTLKSAGYNLFSGSIDGLKDESTGECYTITVPKGSKTMLGALKNSTISNLNIYGEEIDGYGVVEYYHNGASGIVIENVTLKSGSHTKYSGFIGGYASGSNPVVIRNCTVESGVVIGDDGTVASWAEDVKEEFSYPYGPSGIIQRNDMIGSFAGAFNGTIENCVSHATVYGRNYVGGIMGFKGQSMGDCIVRECVFDGQVIATGNYVGGIIGSGYEAPSGPNTPCVTIQNCAVTGSVKGGNYVGGIFGGNAVNKQCWNNGVGYIRGNYFDGTLAATAENAVVGGIIGHINTIDRYNIIENNYYREGTATKGIGSVTTVDTNTDTQYGRTDDPMGADADKLTAAFEQDELANGKLVEKLNAATVGNAWKQSGSAPALSSEKHVVRMTSGALNSMSPKTFKQSTFQTELAKSTYDITVTWSDGSTETVSASQCTLGGLDLTTSGYQLGSLTYQGYRLYFGAKINADDSDAANLVIEQINALGTITLESKEAIEAAEAAYAALTDSQKALVTNYATLTAARAAYDKLVADHAAADAVKALIEAIGDVTLDSKDAIEAAEKAYDELTDAQKALVTNYATLTAARKAYDNLAAAKAVEDLIDAIGDVTLGSKDDIDAARAAYDALTGEQKALVGNYQTLLDAEASYEAQLPPVVPGKLDFGTAEKTEPAVGFSDVASGDWFADAVNYVYQNGLMNGTGDGKFSPNANTTRGMIVTILARLEGVDTTTGATWYEAGRQWAMKNGISDGTSMDGQITREQLATMLYRYAQLKGRDTTARAELSTFADASGVSDWAAEAMQWAVAKGLIQGSSNQLTPTAPATRAQVATILMRFIG